MKSHMFATCVLTGNGTINFFQAPGYAMKAKGVIG